MMFTNPLFDFFNLLLALFLPAPTAQAGFFTWLLRLIGLPVCLGMVVLSGVACGKVDSNLTPEQRAEAHEQKLAWVDKAVEIAQKNGLAYIVMLESDGEPAFVIENSIQLKSGLEGKIIMFGNFKSPAAQAFIREMPEVVPDNNHPAGPG